MTRKIVLWVVLVSASAGMALQTSLRVRAQEDRLNEIHRAVASEQERIRVLTAEWHMLKSPARLEELASRHLDTLGRIAPTQMEKLEDLPTPDTVALADAAGVTADVVKEDVVKAADAPIVVAAAPAPMLAPVAKPVAATPPQPVRTATPVRAPVARETVATPARAAPVPRAHDELGALIAREGAKPAGIGDLIARETETPRVVLASTGRTR